MRYLKSLFFIFLVFQAVYVLARATFFLAACVLVTGDCSGIEVVSLGAVFWLGILFLVWKAWGWKK